jgi:S-disulfanyl-L-cysteine oxidoreductase SoxD
MEYGALRGWLISLAVLWLAFFIAAAAYLIFAGPVTPEILEEEEAATHQRWYTEAQAERGEEEYNAHCARCHGVDLAGIGPNPPLVGSTFLNRWEGRSVERLFHYTRTMMPLDNPGALEDDTYIRITAYTLQANGFPPGDEALPLDTDQLGQLVISREHVEEPAVEEEPEEEPVVEEPEEEPEEEPAVEVEPEEEPDVEEDGELRVTIDPPEAVQEIIIETDEPATITISPPAAPEEPVEALEPAEPIAAAGERVDEEELADERPAEVQEAEITLGPEEAEEVIEPAPAALQAPDEEELARERPAEVQEPQSILTPEDNGEDRP